MALLNKFTTILLLAGKFSFNVLSKYLAVVEIKSLKNDIFAGLLLPITTPSFLLEILCMK